MATTTYKVKKSTTIYIGNDKAVDTSKPGPGTTLKVGDGVNSYAECTKNNTAYIRISQTKKSNGYYDWIKKSDVSLTEYYGENAKGYYFICKSWNNTAIGVYTKGSYKGKYNSKSEAVNYYSMNLSDEEKNTYSVYDGSTGVVVFPDPNADIGLFEDDDSWIDDIDFYGGTEKKYGKSLEELKIKSVKNIMGLPYQWLIGQDPRVSDPRLLNEKEGIGYRGYGQYIGRTFGTRIIADTPMLLITPGLPLFKSTLSDDQKTSIINKLLNKDKDSSNLKNFMSKGSKYYSLQQKYTEYYEAVNALCRTASIMLGIGDTKVNGHKLATYNQYGTYNRNDFDQFLGPYKGCIAFYVDSETSIQDSFGNDTTQSQIADQVNQYSSIANELNYLMGNSRAGKLFDSVRDQVGESIESLSKLATEIFKGSNLITSIGGSMSALLNGGKLIFPEIWSDSSFSRSYDITVKLFTPDSDKLSWYLNIWVPIAHCLGMVLPRQLTANGYISPFIVRAFYKGLFNVDMGIITNMSIKKGDDCRWTRDGLPTCVEVSFTIKDLYNYMTLPEMNIGFSVMNNISMLDYIGNMCGININEIDIARNAQLFISLNKGVISDSISLKIFGAFGQWCNNKVMKTFSFF